ncbi:MAG: sulfatase [Acidobacteria bacterium]|nr:MAG: sulfatase [Acidobacteriota bacterium]
MDETLLRDISRRAFLGRGAAGLGLVALNSLLGPRLFAAAQAAAPQSHGVVNPLDFPPKAKRVIFLYQAGGPSHLETFDYKPKLADMSGKPMPESFTRGQQIAQLQGQKLTCFGPTHGFKQFGESGQLVCDLFPHIGGIVDETCIVRSMWTEQINHDPAHTFMNSGSIITGRPSMGSWVLYGLGAETDNLPGFVVLVSQGNGGQMQPIAARQWSAGMLPSKFQGVRFNSVGDPVLYITNPRGVSRDMQLDSIQTINALNTLQDRSLHDPEIQTRIAQYEMAFRMQASVPGLLDMSNEPQHVLEMYGAKPGDGSFASNCLLARRLAERGVRFIQLYHRDWDHHSDVRNNLVFKAEEVDKPTAALISDLKQRGMLDDTLVVWGGEFGRTPMSQGRGGRDHHIKGFSFMLAGGGIKKGLAYGATDDLGYAAVENPVSVHDFHATMLYLLGVDAARLAVKYQGLDVRLTGPQGGTVVRDLIA